MRSTREELKSPGVTGILVAIPLWIRILGQERWKQTVLCKISMNYGNSLYFRDTKEIHQDSMKHG